MTGLPTCGEIVSKKLALVACMRKLLTILNAMVRTNARLAAPSAC